MILKIIEEKSKSERKLYKKVSECLTEYEQIKQFFDKITNEENRLERITLNLTSRGIITQVYIKDSNIDFKKKESEFDKWRETMDEFYDSLKKIVQPRVKVKENHLNLILIKNV